LPFVFWFLLFGFWFLVLGYFGYQIFPSSARMNNRFFVTCVGSSAGGLDALREFFSSVDPNTSSAFVVVSHLPHHHHTRLHHILAGVTKMKTHLIDKDTAVEPHHIYVLPGNLRVKIMHDVLIVRERGLHEISNNAIDEFLFSLAEDKGERAIAIILSGLGKDGSQGANAVHKKRRYCARAGSCISVVYEHADCCDCGRSSCGGA
jgi:chemotaxis response regulator CheB